MKAEREFEIIVVRNRLASPVDTMSPNGTPTPLKAPPIVAILTDFGPLDPYVGIMKGVILGICPTATLVDIGHEIPAQDVQKAALDLADSVTWFPPHSVFLAVVDPGVGSDRRAVVASVGATHLVGPDNGLLAPAVERLGAARASVSPAVRDIREGAYTLPPSQTFHGRDIFAPVAAHLAAGVDPERIGPLGRPLAPIDLPQPRRCEDPPGWVGRILRVDGFGNLRTNIPGDWVAGLEGRTLRVSMGAPSPALEVPLVMSYATVLAGDLLLIVGSAGTVELSVAGGSASEALGIGAGQPLELRPARAEPG